MVLLFSLVYQILYLTRFSSLLLLAMLEVDMYHGSCRYSYIMHHVRGIRAKYAKRREGGTETAMRELKYSCGDVCGI